MKQRLQVLRKGRDLGATAVEFALVVPLLLVLVFGIIDYGLWFSDSLSMRQGVREAARQGVVGNFDTDGCGGGGAAALACTAKDRIGGITGDPAVKVVAPAGWVKGEPLIVCAQLEVSAGTGLVPLPNDKVITSKVEMAIENIEAGADFGSFEDSAPAGKDWSWCS